MSRHSAAFLVSCLCIAVSLAGDFKSVVIPETGPTLTVVVPDKHFLRIHNFTQEGTATQRGVVIVNAGTSNSHADTNCDSHGDTNSNCNRNADRHRRHQLLHQHQLQLRLQHRPHKLYLLPQLSIRAHLRRNLLNR